MKKVMMAAVAFLAAIGAASAQTTLLATPDTDGCQTMMPYAWTELAGGAEWTTVVDLTGCDAQQLGWFKFNGWKVQGKNNDQLKGSDGIVLTVQQLSTEKLYSTTTSNRKEYVYIMAEITAPTEVLLKAVNTGNKAKQIRLTWRSVD